MFSLFCPHRFTPPRRHTVEDRSKLGITASAVIPACNFVESCCSCGKVREVYLHSYGAPFEKDYFLEDGEKLKMLKRHLRTTYNLTPDAYRQKWGLPQDYPMVAPNYAEERSAFAKRIGLGRGGRPPGKRVRKKSAETVAAKP